MKWIGNLNGSFAVFTNAFTTGWNGGFQMNGMTHIVVRNAAPRT